MCGGHAQQSPLSRKEGEGGVLACLGLVVGPVSGWILAHFLWSLMGRARKGLHVESDLRPASKDQHVKIGTGCPVVLLHWLWYTHTR